MDLTIVTGAGSVISNVLDYAKWIKALIGRSEPISKDGYKALLTSRSILEIEIGEEPSPFTGPQTYALGWFTGSYQGYEFFTHSGGMEAFGAEVIFFPKLKYGIVSLGNTASTSNAVEERLMWHLIDEKLGVPEEERFGWVERYGVLSCFYPNRSQICRALDGLKNKEERYQNASKTFYPSVPDPPIAASLPLENYTGIYYNHGYHNMTVSLKDDQLFVNRSDHAWKIGVDLEHVSGDHFMAYVDSLTAPGLVFREAVPAEFKVGADGVSNSFGILAAYEMGPNSRIWFDRI